MQQNIISCFNKNYFILFLNGFLYFTHEKKKKTTNNFYKKIVTSVSVFIIKSNNYFMIIYHPLPTIMYLFICFLNIKIHI